MLVSLREAILVKSLELAIPTEPSQQSQQQLVYIPVDVWASVKQTVKDQRQVAGQLHQLLQQTLGDKTSQALSQQLVDLRERYKSRIAQLSQTQQILAQIVLAFACVGLLTTDGKLVPVQLGNQLRNLTTSLQIALTLQNQKSVQETIIDALIYTSKEFDNLLFYEGIKGIYLQTEFGRITKWATSAIESKRTAFNENQQIQGKYYPPNKQTAPITETPKDKKVSQRKPKNVQKTVKPEVKATTKQEPSVETKKVSNSFAWAAQEARKKKMQRKQPTFKFMMYHPQKVNKTAVEEIVEVSKRKEEDFSEKKQIMKPEAKSVLTEEESDDDSKVICERTPPRRMVKKEGRGVNRSRDSRTV